MKSEYRATFSDDHIIDFRLLYIEIHYETLTLDNF